jgi:hypothetical protein
MKISSLQQNILDRLFGWWYAIAAPPEVSEDAPLHERTFIRKSRFTSIILLIELVYHIIYLYMVLASNIPAAVPPISITIVCFIIGIILNRFRKRQAANIIAFAAIELSMCLYFVNRSFGAGGFSVNDRSVLSILVSPDIIAVSLFPIGVALLLSTFNCLFVVVILAFFPKTPDMIHQLAMSGPVSYFQSIAVQAVVILVSLFWVNNTVGEMKRANQAEEVNKLVQALASQQQVALQEKQQLEESVQQIVTVHMEIANGNFDARVPLDQKGVLWSIAGSLNNLLARLQRWRQEAQNLQYVERSIQQTLYDIQQAKAKGTPLSYRRTGTMLDLLIAEFIGGASPGNLSQQQQDNMQPMSGQLSQPQLERMTQMPRQPFRQQRNRVTLEPDPQG